MRTRGFGNPPYDFEVTPVTIDLVQPDRIRYKSPLVASLAPVRSQRPFLALARCLSVRNDSTDRALGGKPMKRVLLAFAAMVFVGSPLLAGVSAARDNNVMTRTGKVNPIALRDMLKKGLKATRPDEKLYIDYVVDLVVLERLPVGYVYASFNYARKRRPDYPFPYFHYSLKALGKRKSLEL
jgi:hypothetical protein